MRDNSRYFGFRTVLCSSTVVTKITNNSSTGMNQSSLLTVRKCPYQSHLLRLRDTSASRNLKVPYNRICGVFLCRKVGGYPLILCATPYTYRIVEEGKQMELLHNSYGQIKDGKGERSGTPLACLGKRHYLEFCS